MVSGASRTTLGAATFTRNPRHALPLRTPWRAAPSERGRATVHGRAIGPQAGASALHAGLQPVPAVCARSTRPSSSSARSTPARQPHHTRLPPNVLPLQARCDQIGGRTDRDTRADRQTTAQTLCQGDHIGRDSIMLVREKVPVRPIPVCTSSSTSSAPCRLVTARALPGNRPGHHDPAFAHNRLQEDCRGVIAHGGLERHRRRHTARESRGPATVRTVAAWQADRERKRDPIVRPWKDPLCRDEFRAAGQPGQFDGDLVGLGTGIAEENPGGRVNAKPPDEFFSQFHPGAVA